MPAQLRHKKSLHMPYLHLSHFAKNVIIFHPPQTRKKGEVLMLQVSQKHNNYRLHSVTFPFIPFRQKLNGFSLFHFFSGSYLTFFSLCVITIWLNKLSKWSNIGETIDSLQTLTVSLTNLKHIRRENVSRGKIGSMEGNVYCYRRQSRCRSIFRLLTRLARVVNDWLLLLIPTARPKPPN